MKFDFMGLIFMIIAIWVGNLLGPMLGGFVGFGVGLIGTFISGIVVYAIFSLLTGTKMTIMGAIIFAICVYASVIITSMIAGNFGFISGIIAIFAEALILSFVYSFIAPKTGAPPLAKAPVK